MSAPLDPPPRLVAPTEDRNADTVDIDPASTRGGHDVHYFGALPASGIRRYGAARASGFRCRDPAGADHRRRRGHPRLEKLTMTVAPEGA